MANNLNSKLTRVDEAIATMRQNLKISSNAPVEEVVNATNFALKDLMNIYIQENEPAEKDGIWLKTQPFEFDTFTVDERCRIKDFIEDRYAVKLSNGQWRNPLYYNGYIYEIDNTNLYRINPITRTSESFKSPNGDSFTIINNKMYIPYVFHNSPFFYEMDLNTMEYTKLQDLPAEIVSSGNYDRDPYGIGSIDHFVIIFGKKRGAIYNTITKEFTLMAPYPNGESSQTAHHYHHSMLPNWGGKILTPGFGPNASSTNRIYFYDVYTNTFSNHLPTPGGNAYWPNRKGVCIIGNDLLMLDGAAVLRYNLMTYELAEVLTVNNVSYTGLFNINEQLGILLDMEICLVSNDNSAYSENTLVILQGKYKMTNREIVLFSLPETSMGKLYFPFNDIFPYINGEFMINIPTYYGNGTEWIKYKN